MYCVTIPVIGRFGICGLNFSQSCIAKQVGYGTVYWFKMASMLSPFTNFVRLIDTLKKLMRIPSPKLRTSVDTVGLQQIKLKSAHDKAGLKMQRMTLEFKLL